jgi:hypothetical protein
MNPNGEEMWRAVIAGENPIWRRGWRLRRMIPGKQRCKNCNAPFTGIGGVLMRLVGRGQYNRNPRLVASRFVWKFGAALPVPLADALSRRTTIVPVSFRLVNVHSRIALAWSKYI